MLANSTIWKANRTKQSLVKTAVLANSTIWKVKQTVKTAVLANSTIWKANRTKQSLAICCKNCGAVWQIQQFGRSIGRSRKKTVKTAVGKFNNLEGQSDEAVAVKTAVLANSTIWKANRTKQ